MTQVRNREMRSRIAGTVILLALTACTPASGVPAAPPGPPPPAPPPIAPTPTIVTASEERATPNADLSEIVSSERALRVLVRRTEIAVLPREGSAPEQNQVLLELLASRLRLPIRWVVVPEGQRLLDALVEGRGDLIGARHVEGPPPAGVAYSTALRLVDEVVVCRASDRSCPASAARATKRTVALPLRDAARGARLKRWKAAAPGVPAVEAPRDVDPLDLLQRVGSGDADLAAAYGDEVETYLSYRKDVRIAFTARPRIPVSWTVRADSPALLEAANGLIYSRALSAHLGETYSADVAEILERQVLRVAMLNNGASYFLHRGQEAGFQYELAQILARKLGVRLAVVVPERPQDMSRLLLENRVDLIPLSPGESGAAAPGIALSNSVLFADYVLVQPAGEAPVTSPAGLSGREVDVRASSAYRPVLEGLKRSAPGLKIVAAAESLETPDLIDLVGKRRIPATVSNSFLLGVERRFRRDVQGTLVLARRQPLVYAARSSSARLLAFVNDVVSSEAGLAAIGALAEKHFGGARRGPARTSSPASASQLSPFDDLIRASARRFGLDWRLVAAQMFHESRFDPDARSWVGAVGLLQVMPRTGAEMGFAKLEEPAENIQAGTKYFAQLLERFESDLPMQQRVRFALAAYNAGLDHVHDARLLAKQNGWDPNRWFRNVEKAMLLLEKAKWYRTVRRGYCRGSEPVAYVSHIQTTYDAYARLVPASGETGPKASRPAPSKKTAR
jgi:membrane-bound lytic murein transglycosylase F